MQSLLLLVLREQHRLSSKQIERATGIPASEYLAYEGGALLPQVETELLATLLNIDAAHLKAYSDQLHYFSHARGIITLQEKRIQALSKALKRYIRKTPLLKPGSLHYNF